MIPVFPTARRITQARMARLLTRGKSSDNVAGPAPNHPWPRHKKAPDNAGAFELLKFSRGQYFATTGPPQLKR